VTEVPVTPTRRPPSSPYRRTLLSSRWWHNWIGVFIGVILTLWVVSGVIMLLPVSDVSRAGPGTGKPIDWSVATISPAQAVAAAFAADTVLQVDGVSIIRLRDRPVYQVRLHGRPPTLIDAGTGRLITIDKALAVAIAGDPIAGLPVERVELVERRGGGYTGAVPAWHVVYGDDAGTEAWVPVATGDVRRSERADRTRAFWGHDVHVFAPLKEIRGGDRSRKGMLWLTSIISMVVILTGYWLSLPRRWRSRF